MTSENGESQLVPPASAPAPGAFGKVELSKVGDEQEFKVSGEKLPTATPPGPFEVWLEDALASNTFFKVDVMTLTSESKGRWELKLEKKGGAPPALGVADVNDIAGRVVQVRDTGGVNVYLTGFVSASNAGNCSPFTPAKKGKMDLTRPDPAPDADAQGEVELDRKGKEQGFEVNAKNLDGGVAAPYSVQLETGLGTGVFTAVAVLQPKPGKPGRYEVKLEQECGPPPILGVTDVDQIPGRKVEVRDAADQVVLRGVCPQLVSGVGKLNFNHKAKLSLPMNPPSPKATGDVRVKFNAPQGQSEFEVHAKNLSNGNSYSVWLEDAVASGVFVKVGDLHGKGNQTKSVEFEANTKDGTGLPFGVATVADLKDRLLQIRDGGDVIHLVGQVP
jgi:hypothetical protein